MLPQGLHQMMRSGKGLPATSAGVPIEDLAEFSRDEVRAIKGFARDEGVTAPIVASGSDVDLHYREPSAFTRMMGRLSRGKISGDEEPIPEHIQISSTSVPTALHEIGHATPATRSAFANKVLHEMSLNLGAGGLVGNILRGVIGAQVLTPPDEDDSPTRRFMYDHAPGMVGATFVPQLAEEVRASAKAIQGARKFGPGALAAVAELLPALGTYVGAAAGPILATMMAKKLVQVLHGAADEQEGSTTGTKHASTLKMPVHETEAPGALKSSLSSAWRMGGTPPRPHTTQPTTTGAARAKSTPVPRPPSNHSYFKDTLQSLANPQRGARLAKPEI
jgi:hypothetical protein